MAKKTKVYFGSARSEYGNNLTMKVGRLFDAAGLADVIAPKDFVAIKMHWGERGNLAYTPPPMIRALVDRVRECGGKPFITDTNTLYRGSRGNAVDNLETSYGNGFTFGTVNAPVIVADGLRGSDYVRVKIGGEHFKSVKIATGIHDADALLVFSHFKGHEATGFGGTLKNLGMGCAAPSGKQNQHSDVKPKVKVKKCIGCGTCMKKCPANAISLTDANKASIDHKKCIGCAECTVVCPTEAIGINWKSDLSLLQRKMAEYATGALKNKAGKCAFFNLVIRVSPDCDCFDFNDVPIVQDIGLLLSTDPVAVDQAAVDLVNASPGIPTSRLGKKANAKDKFRALFEVDWAVQLDHAEKMGIGTRKYELVEVK